MNNKKEKNIVDIILKIFKVIFLTITIPLWGPWKLLFGRKHENSNRNGFRTVGLATLNVVKFVVFVFVIFLEVLAVHKIRYSPLTYGFTRESVRDYYLNENRMVLDGLDEDIRNDFEVAFNYIDNWEMDEKNKMNVILDSSLVKRFLKYTDNKTIDYILNKFNNDSNFRENMRDFVKNIDVNISRFLKELPEDEMDRLNKFINPIIAVGSWAIDYAATLNIGDAVIDWAVDKYNIGEKSLYANSSNVDKAIKTGVDFNSGVTLETVINYWK